MTAAALSDLGPPVCKAEPCLFSLTHTPLRCLSNLTGTKFNLSSCSVSLHCEECTLSGDGDAKICTELTHVYVLLRARKLYDEISALCVNELESKIQNKEMPFISDPSKKIHYREPLFAYLNNKSPALSLQMQTQHFAELSFLPVSPPQASLYTFSNVCIH